MITILAMKKVDSGVLFQCPRGPSLSSSLSQAPICQDTRRIRLQHDPMLSSMITFDDKVTHCPQQLRIF